MSNYLKIKKRKILLTFLLIFNQLISSSYAINNRIVIRDLEEKKNSVKILERIKFFNIK